MTACVALQLPLAQPVVMIDPPQVLQPDETDETAAPQLLQPDETGAGPQLLQLGAGAEQLGAAQLGADEQQRARC